MAGRAPAPGQETIAVLHALDAWPDLASRPGWVWPAR